MSVTDGLSRDAGARFRSTLDLTIEDAMQRRFRYHLLRLTLAGVTRDEIPELVELGRLAFSGSDTTAQTNRIKEQTAENSLAFTFADIVAQAGTGLANPRTVLLGAVLGAYTSLADVPDEDEPVVAVVGAIAGAAAAAASEFIVEQLDKEGMSDYLKLHD